MLDAEWEGFPGMHSRDLYIDQIQMYSQEQHLPVCLSSVLVAQGDHSTGQPYLEWLYFSVCIFASAFTQTTIFTAPRICIFF